VRRTANRTLVAAVIAWLAARVLRRLIAVALLAALLGAGVVIADRRGVDVGGVRRVVHCETRAVRGLAKQLRDARSESSPSAGRRPLRAPRRLGQCAVKQPSAPTRPRADRGAR